MIFSVAYSLVWGMFFMSFSFTKMSGNGNDFIIIDNRLNDANELINKDFVVKVCARGLSIGADGLIFIEKSNKADFKWRFYNSDGTEAAMCGNGARCAARYAYINNIAPKEMTFETGAGIIEGFIMDNGEVKVLLTPPHSFKDNLPNISVEDTSYKPYFINTGVPHAVIFTDKVDSVNVMTVGSVIRHHNLFAPEGTNVNFASVTAASSMKVRTFERGVEGETLACGTGCTAAALVAVKEGLVESPVKVLTAGGKILTVYSNGDKVYLQGEARLVYKGIINTEAYNY